MKLLPLEHVTRVAPLGLGFWDTVTGSFVADGLQVTAIPKSTPVYRGKPSVAAPNPSGVFAFHHLPGLTNAEWGKGDEDYWKNLPAPKDFIVTVTDLHGRFLPFKIPVKAPEQCKVSWSRPAVDSVPKIGESLISGIFPLFSSPARSIPYGMAGIRATIKMGDQKAAWARVDVYSQNEKEDPTDITLVARGIANQAGELVLIFPYPKFMVLGNGKKNPPLTSQEWFLNLKVFFSPKPAYPEIPHLSDIALQAETDIDQLEPYGNDVPADKTTLNYGVELVLKTNKKSELLIKAKP